MFASLSRTYDSITYDLVGVPLPSSFSQNVDREASSSSGLMLDNTIAPYGFGIEQMPKWRNRLLEWLSGDERATRRLALIVAVGVGAMVVVLVSLSITQALSTLLTAS